MNEVMKVLTIMASIFILLIVIAGIYGMNFDNTCYYKTKLPVDECNALHHRGVFLRMWLEDHSMYKISREVIGFVGRIPACYLKFRLL